MNYKVNNDTDGKGKKDFDTFLLRKEAFDHAIAQFSEGRSVSVSYLCLDGHEVKLAVLTYQG